MNPVPGDMVQIITNAWEVHPVSLVATTNSIARVMSFEEYREYIIEKREVRSNDNERIEQIHQWMVQMREFPLMFVEVAPPSQKVLINDCQVGKVIVLDSRFFQIIDKGTIDNTE